jgi:cytoskeletal protein RodZ
MILFKKAEFGESFVRAFIRKYFRNEDAEEILQKNDKELIETVLEIQNSIENENSSKPIDIGLK